MIAAILALALLGTPQAFAGVRQIEAVGAVPLATDARPTSPPRDAAVRRALNEAVWQVALDLVPAMEPEVAAEFLPEVLGAEPFDYTTRFRILEDRGARPALFTDDPEVEFEYVVVVEAHIDADRVEERLVAAGLLVVRASAAPQRELRVVLEDLESFGAYAALRRALLEGVRVRSALPVELARGRAVLAVTSADDPEQLLERLLQAAPPELRITPVEAGGEVLVLRIALEMPPGGAASGGLGDESGGAHPRD